MRAITVSQYGAPSELTQMPDPHPGPGQVLIKVQVAGVNPMDRQIADGYLQSTMAAQFPLVLGADLAGVVEALGDRASRFSAGDELFGQLLIAPIGSAGTYAEYVTVSEDVPLVRIPQGLDQAEAASLPTTGVTALEIIESLGQITGKTVLIVGAAGGVGSFTTQLAVQAGAHVIAADRAEDAERLRTYGAAETVDSASASVVDAVRQAHPDGIDLLIDLASSADAFAALAALVRRGGTALTTRYVADIEALASREISGVNFSLEFTSEALERFGDLVAHARIVIPPITKITLEEVPALNATTHATGKTVITI
jgi:NADPH:quinone reductase-like Zn-dependent oxidoreductase